MNGNTLQNLKLLALTVALLAGVSNAFAQSAEETVAFMTDGMEDGREGVSQSKQYLVTQEPGQPKFTITTTPASAPVTVSVQRIDECKFSVEYVGEPEMEGEYILDFAQFVGAGRIGGEVSLQFSGSCPLKFRGECVKDHMVPTGFAVEPLRLDKAIAYFKKTACAGRAF